MVEKEVIRKIKRATVAVGLVKRNDAQPLVIYGSGFVVDSNGVIATADHVLNACKMGKVFHKKKYNIETDYAIFRSIHNSTEFSFDTAVIGDLKNITYSKKLDKFPLNVIDLGFGKMLSPIPDCIPLDVDSENLNIFDEVAICGFPSGEFTLDLEGERMGVRYSPLFQIGRISGLLPFDDANDPYGIQTDIIGVGGSSGSPIINPKNGKIIGIAQQVIPATVEVDTFDEGLSKNKKRFGFAKIGQVYGLSNSVLITIVNTIKKYYRGEKIDEFKIHASGLNFTHHFKTEVKVDKSKLQ